MKKYKLLLLVLVCVCNLSACDNTTDEVTQLQENNSEEEIVSNEIRMELPVTSVFSKKDEEPLVVVFTGRVEYGTMKNTDNIYIILEDGTEIEAPIYKLEQYKKNPTEVSEGDNIGVVVKDINIDVIYYNVDTGVMISKFIAKIVIK